MLYRLLWHTAHYRIPEILSMTVLECAVALGVDQHHRPNLPYGVERVDTSASIEDRMQRPTEVVVMDPALMQAALSFQVAKP